MTHFRTQYTFFEGTLSVLLRLRGLTGELVVSDRRYNLTVSRCCVSNTVFLALFLLDLEPERLKNLPRIFYSCCCGGS